MPNDNKKRKKDECEGEDDESMSLSGRATSREKQNEKSLKEKLKSAVFGGSDIRLYAPASLFNVKDKLHGI